MTDFGRRPGDMLKSVYDSDNDGTVDDSEKLEASSKAQVQDHTPKAHAHAKADVTDLVTNLAGKAPTVHTHTEAQISDLDHDALKIKGVIVNDAAIGDQKVLAYDLGTERIVYIEPAAGGATIESIQSKTVTLAGGTSYEDVTITAVVTANTMLLHNGATIEYDYHYRRECTISLTDETTVRVERGNATDYPVVVRFMVLEFASGIESLQRGIKWVLSSPATVTIDEVDLTKAILNICGVRTLYDTEPMNPVVHLSDATTITFTFAQTASLETRISWEVIEFSA